jgi:hypothetical protein
MIIVCDASPLIALSLCDKLDLLDSLFREVVVPEAVYKEVNREGKPEAGKIAAWAQGKVQSAEKKPLFQEPVALVGFHGFFVEKSHENHDVWAAADFRLRTFGSTWERSRSSGIAQAAAEAYMMQGGFYSYKGHSI